MKKLFGPVIMATGLIVVSSVAEARCVTTRSGNRSVTNCDGVITERHGNRSVTYGRGGTVTERHGTRSRTTGPGYSTYRDGNRSTTYQRSPWYY